MANFRRALMGINAAVVGLLLAALYDPVWTSAILGPADFALGLAAFCAACLLEVPAMAGGDTRRPGWAVDQRCVGFACYKIELRGGFKLCGSDPAGYGVTITF